jgi:hypothetical protein
LEYPDRLDFTLPDFTRFRWVSDQARTHWEPRLQRISEVWAQVEWRSVCAGVRRCALVPLTPRQLVAQAAPWIAQGLVMFPLAVETGSTQPYASNVPSASSEGAEVLRIVIGAQSAVGHFKSAWAAGDNEAMGELLGYPACWRTFFAEVWVRRVCVDTTWPMASNTRRPEEHIIAVAGPKPWANVLGRWFGVRADAQRLIEVLTEKAERLLLYMYPGYSDEGFESFVTRLGLTIVRRADAGDAALIRA